MCELYIVSHTFPSQVINTEAFSMCAADPYSQKALLILFLGNEVSLS